MPRRIPRIWKISTPKSRRPSAYPETALFIFARTAQHAIDTPARTKYLHRLIPWDKLREQLWSDDTNPYRLKQRMEQAQYHLVHGCGWTELNAEAKPNGLLIGPPKNGIQFMPEGRARRKLGILPRSSEQDLVTI